MTGFIKAVFVTFASGFAAAPAPPQDAPSSVATASSVATFRVDGMKCGGCAGRIRGELSKVAGVANVEVDLAAKTVTVKFDPAKTDAARLAAEIKKLGYEARPADGGSA